jgi:hypothetical protein
LVAVEVVALKLLELMVILEVLAVAEAEQVIVLEVQVHLDKVLQAVQKQVVQQDKQVAEAEQVQ